MTDTLDDRITTALEAEADRCDQVLDRPQTWATIEQRIGRERRKRRSLVALAAAAACITAVVVVSDSLGEDSSGRVEMQSPPDDDPATSTTLAPEDNPDPVLDQPGPAPTRAQPPETFVAVTEDGRVVVVDTATGAEIRQLAAEDDPRTEDPTVAGQPLSVHGVEVSPEGATVWFDTCCEPAGGAIYQVPTDGSTPPEYWGSGYQPEFASSSGWFASLDTGFGVTLNNPAAEAYRYWQGQEQALTGGLQEATWSLDGRHLVAREGVETGRLVVVDATQMSADPGSGNQEPRVLPGGDWKLPTFRRDGLLMVATRRDGLWIGTAVDVETGDERPDIALHAYDVEPLDQDHDASGEWLLVVTETRVWWYGPDHQFGQIMGRYYAATW